MKNIIFSDRKNPTDGSDAWLHEDVETDPLFDFSWATIKHLPVKHGDHDQKTHGNWARNRSGGESKEPKGQMPDKVDVVANGTEVREVFGALLSYNHSYPSSARPKVEVLEGLPEIRTYSSGNSSTTQADIDERMKGDKYWRNKETGKTILESELNVLSRKAQREGDYDSPYAQRYRNFEKTGDEVAPVDRHPILAITGDDAKWASANALRYWASEKARKAGFAQERGILLREFSFKGEDEPQLRVKKMIGGGRRTELDVTGMYLQEGDVFIHNHTDPETLSLRDFSVMQKKRLGEVWAVTDDRVYRMGVNWKGDKEADRHLAKGLNFHISRILDRKPEVVQQIRTRKLSGPELHNIMHEIWTTLSKESNAFWYDEFITLEDGTVIPVEEYDAVKHLRGTPNDHDQSSHAGSRSKQKPADEQFREWEAMSVGDRFKKWDEMDEVQQDQMNQPGVTIKAELESKIEQFGEWPTGSWPDALQARLDQYGDFVPEDVKPIVTDRMVQAEVAFTTAGASPEQARALLQDMTDALAVQENESLGRQLGDHGIRHLLGDEIMAQEILSLHPEMDTPEQRAALILASVYHDTGYIAPAGKLMFGKDHPRASTVHYNANLKKQVQEALGKDVADHVSVMISTHDSTEIDWSDPAVTSLRLADNLALFHKEKLPGLFKYVPDNVDVLVKLGTGDLKVDAAKKEMKANIDGADLTDGMKVALHRAADEVNPLTAKTTIGRLNGEISKFDWIESDAGGHLKVEMHEGNEIPPEVWSQLDMGRKQFDKFAKAYGLDPDDLWDDYEFRIIDGNVVLLEASIVQAIKAFLNRLIIPVLKRFSVKDRL